MAFRRKTFRRSPTRFNSRLKRKSFSWQYVIASETAHSRSATPVDTILFNASDWATGSNAEPVKNVSLDLRIMFAWSPEITALEYDSWFLFGGIFVLDSDEVSTTLDATFAVTRALWWNAQGINTGEQPTAQGVSPDHRAMNWRVRARQRFMKFDDELRLITQTNAVITATVADLRRSVFGRISWETP